VKALAPLHGSRSLAFVYLSKATVPADEVDKLAKALPQLRINLW
jgi:hypothetical protein